MRKRRGYAVAAATVLNQHAEVGDGWRGGATWRASAVRGGERGGATGGLCSLFLVRAHWGRCRVGPGWLGEREGERAAWQ
jgi:hypothetical protein